MRTRGKPLFKTHEIVAIVVFLLAATGIGVVRLVY
ncbi:hypothetical protein J2800_003050 [Caulobacter rhizosphaerae]|jgi:hypothetical protein|uniref:Uncharacterized protein n=1 Tax=Caulobacter rhizosphaerae TaxID=2010972 RepID=A0ABU1N1K3_9CAUL|nr:MULTISPECIES: hypothetical protein [Caulobacter]MDR6532294.1 hypothetical protein [Caulobacter rhizosphaerae]